MIPPKNQCVSVYSPGGAFWTVVKHPAQDVIPAEVAETAKLAIRKEYDQLDCEAVRGEFAGVDLVGYDLNFYCLDLTNTAWIRAGRKRRPRTSLFARPKIGRLRKWGRCFRAMMASLLSHQQ